MNTELNLRKSVENPNFDKQFLKSLNMKNKILLSTLAFSLVYLLAACGGEHSHDHGDPHSSDEAQENVEAVDDHDGHDHGTDVHEDGNNGDEEKGVEFTSAYVCPMHCEGSGSEEPGKCPVCDMDYVENKEI